MQCTAAARPRRQGLSSVGGAWLADFGEGLAVGDDRGAAGLGDHMVLQAKQTATHRCAIVRKHTNNPTGYDLPVAMQGACVRACVRAHIAEAGSDPLARLKTSARYDAERSEVSRVQHTRSTDDGRVHNIHAALTTAAQSCAGGTATLLRA